MVPWMRSRPSATEIARVPSGFAGPGFTTSGSLGFFWRMLAEFWVRPVKMCDKRRRAWLSILEMASSFQKLNPGVGPWTMSILPEGVSAVRYGTALARSRSMSTFATVGCAKRRSADHSRLSALF